MNALSVADAVARVRDATGEARRYEREYWDAFSALDRLKRQSDDAAEYARQAQALLHAAIMDDAAVVS